MKYKIDKRVPIPSPRGRGVPTTYPWAEMKVGDSFFVPKKNLPKHGYVTIHVAGNQWALRRKFDHKFSCRTVDGGVRVWRIK